MVLNELLKDFPGVIATAGDLNTRIDALVPDSREKCKNGLFFCISGARFDAHLFAAQAVANGCVALVVTRFVPGLAVAQVQVDNVRTAVAYIASAFFGHPARQLRLIGISGTKGKTTTSYLLKAIMEKAGYKVGLIGTTGNMIGQEHIHSNLTTPDPIDLHRCFRQMADAGVQVVSMEVSAHAIDMHRLAGLNFEAAGYTNLSQDHLDYFQTMDNYFATKKSFFVGGQVLNAALNADDETSVGILQDLKVPYLTFGISANADLFARDIEISENGVNFSIQLRGVEEMDVEMQMTGMFNVYNALAAVSLAMIVGVDKEAIREGLRSVKAVPGRIEMLETGTPYKVILDYSHSPDALENILSTVRMFTKKRLIVLYGCGGDRDHGKRPIMGEIGGRLADFSILTSDNPRMEDPDAILEAIEEGMKPTHGRYRVIENRREAIRYALKMGQEGDVIILAGKGHETYQDIMGVKRPFDEKVIVQEILDELIAERRMTE
jgi:UDP-N-acetylmuramoyl-L-alanyl-D-glutamate--2,6-diaminopimelate ligase